MIKNMKLTNKVLAAIFTVILGMGIIAVSSYLGFKKIGLEIEEIADYQIPISLLITELEKDILEEEILTYKLIIACVDITSTKFKQVEEHILKLEKETEKTIIKAENYVQKAITHNKDLKTKEKYKEFLVELKKLEKEQLIYKDMLQKLDRNVKLDTYNNLDNDAQEIEKQLNKMDENIIKLIKKMNELLKNSTKQAEKDEIFILQLIEIVFTIALIISLIITFYLAKYIKKSISQFQDGLLCFFKYINKETSNAALLQYNGLDEIGLMSQIINKNILKTKKVLEEDKKLINDTVEVLTEFEKGDLHKRVTSQTSNESLNQLTHLINKMGDNLEKNIKNILNILEEYSNNNFINKVQTSGIKEHLLNLALGINTLGESITQNLIENKKNGIILQNSSNKLKSNVNVCSQSSTETTASLEETSAALEEITNTMINNTDNIDQVTSYATNVTNSAKNGENLTTDTMNAMDEINEQVISINEAITIIDQIAFQTNILSLNAAVEAATAGEAGKGFAVVAGEVRNLATRSAQAAKEIKEIVETATQKAQMGKGITQNMLKGYQELNLGVNKTLELIQNIDKASKEQQVSVQQINDAISELDQQTQRNNAITVETNDIAQQTQKLSDIIIENVNKNKFRE